MADDAPRSALLSSQKNADAGQVILHPVVLISTADYITRHALREQKGPIVGALLGQQNGREITVEFAFDCHVILDENGSDFILHADWFQTRLEQMRIVHKDRNLDLVGWYTTVPRSGPDTNILPIHNQILHINESAILLGFHPADLLEKSVGGKLPLTIYESNYEVDDYTSQIQNDGEDKEMKDGEATLKLKFRELPYTVETHEAEMISMNFVAASASSAAAAGSQEKNTAVAEADPKGKRRAVAKDTEIADASDPAVLSKEEEETIAAITAKANAIKMMKSRVELLNKYLKKLPPSYANGDKDVDEPIDEEHTPPLHTVLRQALALVNRLNVLEPSDKAQFRDEMLREANDVRAINLLNEVLGSVSSIREVGKKFHTVESAKARDKKMPEYGNASVGTGFSGSGLPKSDDLFLV